MPQAAVHPRQQAGGQAAPTRAQQVEARHNVASVLHAREAEGQAAARERLAPNRRLLPRGDRACTCNLTPTPFANRCCLDQPAPWGWFQQQLACTKSYRSACGRPLACSSRKNIWAAGEEGERLHQSCAWQASQAEGHGWGGGSGNRSSSGSGSMLRLGSPDVPRTQGGYAGRRRGAQCREGGRQAGRQAGRYCPPCPPPGTVQPLPLSRTSRLRSSSQACMYSS